MLLEPRTVSRFRSLWALHRFRKSRICGEGENEDKRILYNADEQCIMLKSWAFFLRFYKHHQQLADVYCSFLGGATRATFQQFFVEHNEYEKKPIHASVVAFYSVCSGQHYGTKAAGAFGSFSLYVRFFVS